MHRGLLNKIKTLPDTVCCGTVVEVKGLMARVTGLPRNCGIGSQGRMVPPSGAPIPIEIVGFSGSETLAMGFAPFHHVTAGTRVEIFSHDLVVFPCAEWRGRVFNAFGDPIDTHGPLSCGAQAYRVHAAPPPSFQRARVGPRLNTAVKALNAFVTCCQGQRLGIFAGSGVGKSVLMSQMAKFSGADVNVIGLIGERGREVREFIEDQLGEEGMARSVVIVSTSDESALMRRQAADLTLAVAEYFRDQGQQVLCMMDSVTRYAMALREIGLSIGEPPATKGYTPSVFSALPQLLERAGPGIDGAPGAITGLFTVLVDGDDHNEPIADAVRGILDGHIVLDRKIAERNRFPAINVLRSISRTMPDCNEPAETALINRAKRLLSLYSDMEDMIRLGAYRMGSDPKVDEAISKYDALENLIAQEKYAHFSFDETFALLRTILPEDPAS